MARIPMQVVQQPSQGRRLRQPQHPFYIYARPFEITPMFIAPVLPGETMRNLKMQARVITDPIINPIIGWWQEFYFFYCKLRDLDGRDDFTAMHLAPTYDLSAYDQESADDPWRYTAVGGIKWVEQCLTRVVDCYFRDEGEVAADHVITAGRPAAQINGNSWVDSLIPASQLSSLDLELLDISAGTTIEGSDDKLHASEVQDSMRLWTMLQTHGLTEMSYEDYLATFGVTVPKAELHKPELIRYVRDWQYPSNTINPSTGAPTSAVSWSIQERADKDRRFDEPGFLFGVSLTRPKLYRATQDGAMAAHLATAFDWLPALMDHDPRTSLREFSASQGPVATEASVAYVADMRDLFLYGDQFVNVDLDTTLANGLDILRTTLPEGDMLNVRYPESADVDALFVTVADGTSGLTKYRVRMDGIVSVAIAGRQSDASPRGGPGLII